MAADSIGSVSVDIRGDYSRLQADFAAAQGLAAKAGAGIASSLTTGMAPAAAQAGVVLDKFGNAFKGVAAGAEAATPPVLNLNAGIQRLIIAQELLRVAYGQTTPEVEKQNAAMAHGVTQIQATSGAIRVLEGSQGIRAVERFLVSIPGIGAALQGAFPLIGAIALFEMIGRIAGKMGELTEAEKKVAEVTKQTDEEFTRLGTELEHIRIEELIAEFGKLGGLPVKQFFDVSNIRDANAAIDAQTGKIRLANEQLEQTNSLYAQAYSITALLQMFNPLIVGERIREMFDLGSSKDQEENIRGLNRELDVLLDKRRNLTAQKELDAKNDARLAAEQRGALGGANIAGEISAGEHLAAQQKAWTDEQIRQDHAAQQLRILGIADTGSRNVAEAQEELRVAQANQAAITAQLAVEVPKRIALIRAEGAARAEGKTPDERKVIGVETETKVGDFQAQSDQKSLEASKVTAAARDKLTETTVTVNREGATKTALAWDEAFSAIDNAATQTYKQISDAAEKSIQTTAKVMEIEAKGKGQTDALKVEQQKLLAERAFGLQIVVTGAQRVAEAQKLAALDDRERTLKLTGLAAEYQIALAIEDEGKKKEEVARIEQEMAAESEKAANASIAAETKILELKKQQSLMGQLSREAGQVPGAIAGGLAKGIVDGKGIGVDIRNSLKGVGQEMLGSVFHQLIASILKQTGVTAALTTVTGAHSGIMSAHLGVMVSHTAVMGAHLIATVALTLATWVQIAWTQILAAIEAIKTFFGFAEGGRPPLGVASLVGEKGPELFIPDQAGRIVPAGKFDLAGAKSPGGMASVDPLSMALSASQTGDSSPANRFGGFSSLVPAIAGVSSSSSSSSQSIGSMTFNVHGVTNPDAFVDHVMRKLPDRLKARSPQFSPYSR